MSFEGHCYILSQGDHWWSCETWQHLFMFMLKNKNKSPLLAVIIKPQMSVWGRGCGGRRDNIMLDFNAGDQCSFPTDVSFKKVQYKHDNNCSVSLTTCLLLSPWQQTPFHLNACFWLQHDLSHNVIMLFTWNVRWWKLSEQRLLTVYLWHMSATCRGH